MLKKAKKWIGYNFNNGNWNKPPREGTDESDEMQQFFKDFRSDLKRELAEVGVSIHSMKPNYYDVTAVVSKGGKFAYISLGDMRSGRGWEKSILVRSMAHAKDWSGGANTYTDFDGLPERILKLL